MNAAHAQMFDFDTPSAPGPRVGSGRLVDERSESWERTYATLIHGGAVVCCFIGIPIVLPLIMWLVKGKESPLVDDHGREQVNMQISVILMTLICVVLAIPTLGIALLFLMVYYVVTVIGVVRGMIAASNGEYFRYPMTIRLIS